MAKPCCEPACSSDAVRIVGGRLGGRRIAPPPGNVTRPTSERVREGLTSALGARGAIQGARVLDLFAGSGALGFEMLSRGAAEVHFVERDPRVAEHIRKAAQILDVVPQVRVLREDVLKPKGQQAILALGPFDLVLADPPYREAAAKPCWPSPACVRQACWPRARCFC